MKDYDPELLASLYDLECDLYLAYLDDPTKKNKKAYAEAQKVRREVGGWREVVAMLLERDISAANYQAEQIKGRDDI